MDKFFKLQENGTNVRTEAIAGITTFLTMSYIIFVQPAILSNPYGAGMDFGSVFMATCLAAAIATFVMAFLANYPIALAPGMGQNVYFSFIVCGTMGYMWSEALGAVFIAGAAFLLLSFFKIRERVIDAIPQGLKLSIAGGIGLLIAMVGLQYSGLIVDDPAVLVRLGSPTTPWALLSIIGLIILGVLMYRKVKGAILIGMVTTAIIGLFFAGGTNHLNGVSGHMNDLRAEGYEVVNTINMQIDQDNPEQVLYGYVATREIESEEGELEIVPTEIVGEVEVIDYTWSWQIPEGLVITSSRDVWNNLDASELVPLTPAAEEVDTSISSYNLVKFTGVVDTPPSMSPTLFKLNLKSFFTFNEKFWLLWEVVFIFFFMDLFDTIGTLLGVGHAAGFLRKDGKLPRVGKALISDAVGTVAGAAMGTSTVTSYIESSTGVAEGGRTGLANVFTGILFLLAIFFKPLVEMIGGGYNIIGNHDAIPMFKYPIIAAPLIIVGSLMMKGLKEVDWDDPAIAISAFITVIIMPLTFSIATGISFGFIAYVLIKFLGGKAHEVHWLLYVLAIIFILRFAFIPV